MSVLPFLFVLFILAAVALFLSGRANLPLVLGLLLLGVNGGMPLLVRSGAIPFGPALQVVSVILGVGALLLLVAGALAFAAGRRPLGPRGSFTESAASMETLLVPRCERNSYARAVAVRDRLHQVLMSAFAAEGVTVTAYTSPVQSSDVWLRAELLLPEPAQGLSLRSGIAVTVDRWDFHRFEQLLDVELRLGSKRFACPGVIAISDAEAVAIVKFLLGKGGSRPPPLPHVRRNALAFWHPRNRLTCVRPDWGTILLVALAVVVLPVPVAGLLACIGILVGVALWRRGRRTYALTEGKPLLDPRKLERMDSWQANILGLGASAGAVRTALVHQLEASAGPGVRVASECIAYAGTDGKVERTQIVVSFRRAIGFVHVEAYGGDLHVGWDSHINVATWMEDRIGAGIDRETGRPVVVNRVVARVHGPNEYDITDVNFLTEWLHTALVRLVRQKLAEHRIDQEIDFTVQRESRRSVLEADPDKGKAAERPSLARRLRRTA